MTASVVGAASPALFVTVMETFPVYPDPPLITLTEEILPPAHMFRVATAISSPLAYRSPPEIAMVASVFPFTVVSK